MLSLNLYHSNRHVLEPMFCLQAGERHHGLEQMSDFGLELRDFNIFLSYLPKDSLWTLPNTTRAQHQQTNIVAMQ